MKELLGPYLVVHPGGDKKELAVMSVRTCGFDQLRSLVTATRNVFDEAKCAESFAFDWAAQNRLSYQPMVRG